MEKYLSLTSVSFLSMEKYLSVTGDSFMEKYLFVTRVSFLPMEKYLSLRPPGWLGMSRTERLVLFCMTVDWIRVRILQQFI
jgi:hypothetical protein